MKREEAIKVITDYLNKDTAISPYNSRFINALDIAIETLQKDTKRHEAAIRASERNLGIVRCKNCKNRYESECPMYYEEWFTIDEGDGWYDTDFRIIDETQDNGFCYMGKEKGV